MNDGNPLRVHLEIIYKQTGVMPQLLADAPGLPQEAEHLWHYYCDLLRESEGKRITASLVQNWQWFTGNALDLWERKAIRLLDIARTSPQVEYESGDADS